MRATNLRYRDPNEATPDPYNYSVKKIYILDIFLIGLK